MIAISLVLNCLVFWVLLNLGWWVERRQRTDARPRPLTQTLLLPLALGVGLTIVDSLRLAFFYQLLVFIIVAILLYWLFSIFLKK